MARVYCQPCWLFSHENFSPGLLKHFKTLEVQKVLMTEGIYCSEFEAMKAPHIMRKRVSYMSNGKTGEQ